MIRSNAGGVFTGRTRDARGRQVKLLDPLLLYVLGRHDVIDRADLEKIAQTLEPGVNRRRKLLLSLIVGVAGLMLIGLAIAIEGRPAWTDLVGTLTNPAIMAAVVGGAIVPWIVARRERRKKPRRVMLGHRRCPHCGYGLRGLPATEEGTTVCPECACAWRFCDASAAAGTGGAAPRLGVDQGLLRFLLLIELAALAASAAVAYVTTR